MVLLLFLQMVYNCIWVFFAAASDVFVVAVTAAIAEPWLILMPM